MRLVPALVTTLVALGVLGAQAGAAAGGAARVPVHPHPHRCVLLPPAQQPKPPRHAGHLAGGLVVTIPATTCNTPQETGATR